MSNEIIWYPIETLPIGELVLLARDGNITMGSCDTSRIQVPWYGLDSALLSPHSWARLPKPPKFNTVSCSSCDRMFHAADSGFSHCEDHRIARGVRS